MSPTTIMSGRRLGTVQYRAETVISCAQNGEDILLNRALNGKKDGFYVDIGAGDPNWDSVTNWFYRIGWRGINVEPNPIFCETLVRFRPEDVNLNVGVSKAPDILTFYQVHANELGHGWGLSSFDAGSLGRAKAMGLRVAQIPVSVLPLQQIVDTYCQQRQIDFLKIDVEGLEATVLSSLDLQRTRPVILCIEAVEPFSAVPAFAEWEPMIVNAGYELGIFDGVNNFYVREESPEVLVQLNAPVNCSDRWRKCTPVDFDQPL